MRANAVGKTVKYLGFEPDSDDDESFWLKPQQIKKQAEHRQRIKRYARLKAEEAYEAGEAWTHITNHFLWGIKTDSRQRSR